MVDRVGVVHACRVCRLLGLCAHAATVVMTSGLLLTLHAAFRVGV
jgi:hypothetical protein